MAIDGRLRSTLRLSLARDVGPVTFGRLMEKFGEPERVFEAPTYELKSVPGITENAVRGIGETDDAQVDAELALAEQHETRIIARGDEDYPRGLSNLPDAPIVLYVRGKFIPDEPAIAIVGSRSATHYGRKQAMKLAGSLASFGFAIVSGMARGIDSAAHEGALNAAGRTVAVLGTGLACIYPPENAELYMRIASAGAVVSEFPMTFEAAPGNFPRRNRIISGLSLGVVVVEAAERSGALITARLAAEQGREVFAVPGMADSPNSRGCHQLIRDGAKLVMDPSDVVEELGPLERKTEAPGIGEIVKPQALALNEVEKLVYSRLDSSARTFDELIEETELSASQLNGTLTVLEMRRLVKRLPGQCFART